MTRSKVARKAAGDGGDVVNVAAATANMCADGWPCWRNKMTATVVPVS